LKKKLVRRKTPRSAAGTQRSAQKASPFQSKGDFGERSKTLVLKE